MIFKLISCRVTILFILYLNVSSRLRIGNEQTADTYAKDFSAHKRNTSTRSDIFLAYILHVSVSFDRINIRTPATKVKALLIELTSSYLVRALSKSARRVVQLVETRKVNSTVCLPGK